MAIIHRPGLSTLTTNDDGQTVRSVPQVGAPLGTILLAKPDQKELVVNPIGEREQQILDAMIEAQKRDKAAQDAESAKINEKIKAEADAAAEEAAKIPPGPLMAQAASSAAPVDAKAIADAAQTSIDVAAQLLS